MPAFTPNAQAVSTDYYLDRLVAWDIMRGDQDGNLDPDRWITRAEFVTMLNRTFGYTKTGAQPFSDVRTSDWYYDDISAAYTAGYFEGTANATASPNATLTREEAATMLCRNLMLQPRSGEDLSFTDSRLASSGSRGYIKAAAEKASCKAIRMVPSARSIILPAAKSPACWCASLAHRSKPPALTLPAFLVT